MRKTSPNRIKAAGILLVLVLMIACSSPPPSYVILCAGDSITEYGYPRFLNSLCKREGVRAKVVNYGKSGHTSGEYRGFLERNLTAMVESRPDFICLQLGTNDIRTDHDHTSAEDFYTNMKQIVHHFRNFATRKGKASRILIATIPPIPDDTPIPFGPESAERIEREINPLIRKLAAEENLALVDNYSVLHDAPHLLPDVHPSDRGYEQLAQNWYLALKKLGMRPVGKT